MSSFNQILESLRWWHIDLAVWVVTVLFGALLTLFCRKIARRIGFIDHPHVERHKRHHRPVPVLGGPALFLTVVVTIGIGLFVTAAGDTSGLPVIINTGIIDGIQGRLRELIWIGVGAATLVIMGMVDDRVSLPALVKFIVQALVCGLLATNPTIRVILFIDNPFVNWMVTTFWFLLILNAINFLDNMDGLAAGIAVIASLFFAIVGSVRDQYFVTLLSTVVCGASCGFLLFNRPPATIFMGDSGSQFLGLMLGLLGSMTTYYVPDKTPTTASVMIPLLILAIPIFDLATVVFIRTRLGRPFYVGDNRHISHRFEKMGMGRPVSVLLVLLLVFASGSGALTLLWLDRMGTALIFAQTFALLSVVSIIQFYGRSSSLFTGSAGKHRP